MGAVRLAWRLQRFELTVLVGACLALTIGGALVAWQLGNAGAELATCYRTSPDSGAADWPCRAIDGWVIQLSGVGTLLTGLGTVAPFLMGVFLGAPIVAREIEHRTAPIAWSLAPSRRGWLMGRILPVAGIVALALLALGQASEAVLLATPPGEIDARHLGMHGPILAVRGLTVLAVGFAIGTILGRSLPAILLTGLVTAAVFVGIHVGRYEVMRAEAAWIDPQQGGWSYNYVHESGFRSDETGEIIGFEEAFERYPDVFAEEQGDQIPPGMTMVYRVNPPDQYPSFVVREAGVTAVLGVAAGGLSLALVRRRRPE
jgi:hypothetical protein